MPWSIPDWWYNMLKDTRQGWRPKSICSCGKLHDARTLWRGKNKISMHGGQQMHQTFSKKKIQLRNNNRWRRISSVQEEREWETNQKGKTTLDNRFVVSCNRDLLVKFQALIKVEWRKRSRSIKYLFKYIHKEVDYVVGLLKENT